MVSDVVPNKCIVTVLAGAILFSGVMLDKDATFYVGNEIQLIPTSQPNKVPALECSDYDRHDRINIAKICQDGGCCDPVGSSTDRCHFTYKVSMKSMVTKWNLYVGTVVVNQNWLASHL